MQKLAKYFLSFLKDIKNKPAGFRYNIIVSLFAKAIGVASTFVTVPLLLLYLDGARYGIWLTLASVLQWITLFDLGLGNGLRNKFAIARANNDDKLASEYVSTAYFIMGIISVSFIVVFVLSFLFFDLSKPFNGPVSLNAEVNSTLMILGCLQSLKFCLDIINYILIADQRVGQSNLINSFSSVLIPIGYFLFAKFYKINLIHLSFISLGIPIAVLVAVSISLFKGSYSAYKPALKNVKQNIIGDIMQLGVRFFLIQITALIVFTTDNIIISNIFSPQDVVPYNIAFKYFSIINFLFIIIITPLWGAFTKEYELGNFDWIKRTLKKLIVIWGAFSLLAFGMLLFSGLFYRFWLTDNTEIPFFLSLNMMIFVIVSNWNNIFAFFLNGISKITLQLISGLFIGIANIPLSIYLAKYCQLGTPGVIMATTLCLLVSSFLQPIQALKIIRGKANGIWNK